MMCCLLVMVGPVTAVNSELGRALVSILRVGVKLNVIAGVSFRGSIDGLVSDSLVTPRIGPGGRSVGDFFPATAFLGTVATGVLGLAQILYFANRLSQPHRLPHLTVQILQPLFTTPLPRNHESTACRQVGSRYGPASRCCR